MIEDYLSDKQKKRKRRRRYLFFIAAFAAAYLFLLGAGWVVLRSPIFRVDRVIVQGNESVSEGDVLAILQSAAFRDRSFWRTLLGFRNMLVWPAVLAQGDTVFDPKILSAAISKQYFSHTVTATIVERKPFAIWCLASKGDGQCYFFDDQGTIFQRAFDTQGSLMVAIHDYSQSGLGLGKKVLPDSFMPNLVSIVRAVAGSGIDVKEIALQDMALQEIRVTAYDGPELYFSLRFSADNDVAVLRDLMAKPGFGTLQYVDFRVENRAYYR